MARKTTYNVDLTVEELKGGAASGPGNTSLNSSGRSQKATGMQNTLDAALPSGKAFASNNPDASAQKHVKGKKNGGSAQSSSSDSSTSSSSSSSSSDSDDGHSKHKQSPAMRRALEPWRYPFYSPSASYRQLDVMAGSHQYTISGFSLARSMGCGTRLCSDFFDVAGQMFRLEVYPAGFTADTRKYISAFLTTPGSVNPNHVLYEIAVLDQTGKDKHIVASRSARSERDAPMLAYCRGVVAAVPRLAKVKALEEKAKRYLPNDMLVIRATVQVLRSWSSCPTVHPHMACASPMSAMPQYSMYSVCSSYPSAMAAAPVEARGAFVQQLVQPPQPQHVGAVVNLAAGKAQNWAQQAAMPAQMPIQVPMQAAAAPGMLLQQPALSLVSSPAHQYSTYSNSTGAQQSFAAVQSPVRQPTLHVTAAGISSPAYNTQQHMSLSPAQPASIVMHPQPTVMQHASVPAFHGTQGGYLYSPAGPGYATFP